MFHNRLVFLLSLFGLLVSAYLAYEYTLATPIACPISGLGCDKVRASQYSSFFGISTPLYGVVYYLFMMITSFVLTTNYQKILIYKLQLLASVFAVLVGIYLTYLEAFVINAYCIWCLTSFVISAIILGVLIHDYRNQSPRIDLTR